MNDTLLDAENQVTIPGEVVKAAGLIPGRDRILFRFEGGEIRGRKLLTATHRPGNIRRDAVTGLVYLDSEVTPEEAEAAALSAHLDRSE